MRRTVVAIYLLLLLCRAGAQSPPGNATVLEIKPPPLPNLLEMPPAYTYQRLGLFCKLDVQLERRMKIPVLLRLGDVRQVEGWEGKGTMARPRMNDADR